MNLYSPRGRQSLQQRSLETQYCKKDCQTGRTRLGCGDRQTQYRLAPRSCHRRIQGSRRANQEDGPVHYHNEWNYPSVLGQLRERSDCCEGGYTNQVRMRFSDRDEAASLP